MQHLVFRTMSRFLPLICLVIILSAICLATILLGSGQTKQLVTEMMIRVVLVVGIYVFVGNSGILSFGHIGFMAIGAYASAWLTCCTLPTVKPMYLTELPEFLQMTSYPLWAGILNAVAISGLVALIIGFALLRLSGIAASIATFAFLAIVASVYNNWDGMTGGSSSLSNIPVDVGPWTATFAAITTVAVAFIHQNSRSGLMLRATRDDSVAARASGVQVLRVRMVSFVISAMCLGAGGALYGSFLGILTVDAFYIAITFLTLAMLVIGGIGSLSGAVIGVLFITAVSEIFRILEKGVYISPQSVIQLPQGVQEVLLGVIMVLVLVIRPAGLMNGREIAFSASGPEPSPKYAAE